LTSFAVDVKISGTKDSSLDATMGWQRNTNAVLLGVAALVAMAALICACPLGMLAHAAMGHSMPPDMSSAGSEGMCPMLCGVPPDPVGVGRSGLVSAQFSPHPAPVLASIVRPIFHPPTSASIA
jgi:hypothetical protein